MCKSLQHLKEVVSQCGSVSTSLHTPLGAKLSGVARLFVQARIDQDITPFGMKFQYQDIAKINLTFLITFFYLAVWVLVYVYAYINMFPF